VKEAVRNERYNGLLDRGSALDVESPGRSTMASCLFGPASQHSGGSIRFFVREEGILRTKDGLR
jgi:hypothetical protein